MITVRNLDKPVSKPEPETTKQELFKLFCTQSNQITDSQIKEDLKLDPEPVKPIEPIKTESDIDILHAQAKLAAKFGARVTITGQWVWAGFDSIPNSEIRQTLKNNSWIWCKNKGKWAYRGKPSHSHKNMSWDYITNKYGQEEIKEEVI